MTAREIEKTPTANTSVNQPESGTYGEKADLNKLRAALPPMESANQLAAQGGPAPMPSPTPGVPSAPSGRPQRLPGGIPSVILAGGPGAALSSPQAAPTVNPQAARLMLLEQLANSPEVSETTREWAQLVLEALRGD